MMDVKKVTIQTDLNVLDIQKLSKSNMIAVDCEMAGLNPHRDPMYLVQVCDQDGEAIIIKAQDWHEAINLQKILSDPGIMKVFHFAIMDCGFILANMSITVQNAYCTKIASKIARTYSESHTLSSLVEDLIGVTLDKKQQTSFWGRDKITDAQVNYAVSDIKYLFEVKEQLEYILTKKGKLPTGKSYIELNKECQAFIPSLVHLWVNGWDFGREDPASVFGK